MTGMNDNGSDDRWLWQPISDVSTGSDDWRNSWMKIKTNQKNWRRNNKQNQPNKQTNKQIHKQTNVQTQTNKTTTQTNTNLQNSSFKNQITIRNIQFLKSMRRKDLWNDITSLNPTNFVPNSINLRIVSARARAVSISRAEDLTLVIAKSMHDVSGWIVGVLFFKSSNNKIYLKQISKQSSSMNLLIIQYNVNFARNKLWISETNSVRVILFGNIRIPWNSLNWHNEVIRDCHIKRNWWYFLRTRLRIY